MTAAIAHCATLRTVLLESAHNRTRLDLTGITIHSSHASQITAIRLTCPHTGTIDTRPITQLPHQIRHLHHAEPEWLGDHTRDLWAQYDHDHWVSIHKGDRL